MIIKNNKGYTLLELLAVLLILIIILSLGVPRVFTTIANANIAADEADLATLNRVTGQYAYYIELDNNEFPDDFDQEKLIQAGFIGEGLIPRQKDKEFKWDESVLKWTLSQISMIEDPGNGDNGNGSNNDDDISGIGFDLTDDNNNWYIIGEDNKISPVDEYEEYLYISEGWTAEEVTVNNITSIRLSVEEQGESFSIKNRFDGSYEINVTIETEGAAGNTIPKIGIYFETTQNEKNTRLEVEFSRLQGTWGVSYSGFESDPVRIDNTRKVYIKIIVEHKPSNKFNSVMYISKEELGDNLPDTPSLEIMEGAVVENSVSGLIVLEHAANTVSMFYDFNIKPYHPENN